MLREMDAGRLAEGQAALRGRLGVGEEQPTEKDIEQRIANLLTVKLLEHHTSLTFRDRTYDVGPIPFTIGCDLQRVRLKLKELNSFGPTITLVDEYEKTLVESVEVIWRAVRPPRGIWVRLRRKLGLERNPLNGASEAEVGYLLGFLSMHQTRISEQGESHRRN